MKRSVFTATVMMLLLSTTLLGAESTVTVRDAWVKESPPGISVMSAYVKIENKSASTYVLTNISSPQFARVEMHRTIIENETARMVRQTDIEIAPGGSLSMAPGGYHLMLFEPAKALGIGDSANLELTFANGEKFTVAAPVVRMEHEGDMHQHHHNPKNGN